MAELERISLSLERDLAAGLDRMVKDSACRNRSEFVRKFIRERLASEALRAGQGEVVGTVMLVYNHHQRELNARLTDIQHAMHHAVLASTHVHLTDEVCAEMIMVRGSAGELEKLVGALGSQKGIFHSSFQCCIAQE